MANTLMFEVGIKEADNQLTELEKRLKNIVSTYGKLELKVQVDGLKTFTAALENIGQGKGLEALQRRLDVLQVTLANAGMAGAKSMQEFEAAVKTNSAVADQYRKRIEELTNARNKFVENTEPWRKANDRLTSFREDKNTLAVFAQEQVAIKNLEDAKARLGQANNQEAESFQKVTTSIETLSTAANMLRTTLGSIDSNKGNMAQLIENFEKLHNEIAAVVAELKKIDPSKLNLSGLNLNIGNISGIGDLNSAIHSLEISINNIIGLFSNLTNAIKLQPVDEQVKALLERCETAEAKLRQVGDAARYLNERAGAKTQQKANTIAGIAGLEDEQVTKVSSTAERFLRLLVEIENQMAKIGKIQALGEQSGFSPTLLKNAQNQLEALKQLVESTIKGKPIAEGLMIPMTDSQLSQFIQQFGLLKAQYRDIVKEADRFNKANEKDSLKQKNQELREAASNMKAAENESRRLTETISNLEALASRAGALGVDTSRINDVINTLRHYKQVMDDIARNNTYDTKSTKLTEPYLQLKRNVKEVAQEIKKNMSAALKPDTEQANAFKEYASIIRQISSLTKTAFNAEKFGLDSSQIRHHIEMLKYYADTLEQIARNGGRGFTAWMQGNVGINYLNRRSEASNEQAAMNAKIAEEKARNAENTRKLTESEQQLANAIKSSNDSMKGQSQILSDLKMMATQYLSIWGAQSFLNNIIEVGGQLEKQRLSIGAILGDISHANDLFGKIKDLAVKSPFGVVELDQFTKQLSAYGFKYNELYDMTKRLADIAAGAGTDVSRLTLAIGHVRAEGALTGYTLRQFAMNNIPMVSELAKKLSEVEHRIVTVADVRKRVSKKEIGYEDVIDVIKNLTNEGGMFYNMQETISQSIQARFKNLRDSLDIMYGEIAESGIGDALKEMAVVLTDMSRNWKAFIPIIQSAIIGFGSYKAAILAVSMAMGKNTLAVTSNIIAYKKKRAEELWHDAIVRKLTAEEWELIRTQERLTASNIRVAMTAGVMTKSEALKLVALRKVDLETTKALVHMNMFTAAEARMALQGRILGMNLGRVGATIKLFAMSFGNSLERIMGNVLTPLNTAFAALMVGMSARQRMNDFNDVREQRRNTINERANEGYKNLLEVTKNFQVGKSIEMTKTDINLSLDEMMDKLKEYSMFYNTTFNEAFKVNEQGNAVHSLAEQYEILAKALEDAANANKLFAEVRDLVMHALETSDPDNGFWKNVGHTMYDWLLTDNVKANLGSLQDSLAHYANSVREAGLAENLLMRDHLSLRRALQGRVGGDIMNMSTEELMNTLSKLRSNMPNVFAEVRKALGAESRNMLDDWTQKCNQMNEAYGVANLKMRKAGNDLYESLKTKFGGDMTKWPSEWREFVFMAMDAATKDVKGFSDMSIEYQNLVRDSFLKPFKISVDSDEAKEKVNDLLIDLQNLVGKTWTIKIGVKGESAWADLETSGKKFQEADKKVKQLEKNLERLNYKSDAYPGLGVNSRQAERVAEEYNEAIAERRAARLIYESYGGDVSDLLKDKNKKPKGGSGEDKEAKRLREIVKLYKDAYDWYVKYEKQVGEVSALIKVQEQFQPLFDEFNKQWNTDLSLDSIPTYKKNIEELLDEAMKIYQQPAHKNNYMVDAIKVIRDAISNVDFEELGRDQDEWASSLTRNLEELTRKWEIFNSVVSDTGDRVLAARLTGITPGATPADLKRLAVSQFAGARIDFDSVLGMSGEEIDHYVENLGVAEDKIKAVQNGLKEWKKAQEDVTKSDLQNYAKWLGSLVDLESIRMRNQEEYNRVLEETNRLLAQGLITQEEAEKRRNAAATNNETKDWQATTMYSSLYNNSLAMAEGDFYAAYNRELASLNDQLKSNTITASDYAEKVSKLNKIMAEFQMQGFLGIKGGAGAYLSGGYQGLIDYHRNRAKEKLANGDEEGARQEKETADAMEQAQKAAEQLTKVFQDLSSGADMVANLFDALGMEGAANAFGDAAGVLGGAASGAQSLSALGPWGMAVGGAIGGLTSIFQLSDKNHERRIQELKREVTKIDNTLQTIKALRERELGYDTGSLRRQMATIYAQNQTKRVETLTGIYNVPDSAVQGMREYYGRYSGGNGYSQEYNALIETRKKYMEMYDEENDKKKKSQEALEEYKTKIAELDEQIMYYIEDLSKELWGIDFDSWASQISDALWTAFENGEDAIEAFHDTAKDIISDVAKKMMNIHLIEPLFNELEEALFGKYNSVSRRYEGGAMRYDSNGNINMQASEPEVLRVLGEFFGEGGSMQKNVEAAEQFYDWVEKITGLDFSSESDKGASTSIKNITEETADLLCSYVNSIRADLSVVRSLQGQYYPMYYEAMTHGNGSLANIENHTAAIMRSNDAIQKSVDDLYKDFHGLRTSTWRMPIA